MEAPSGWRINTTFVVTISDWRDCESDNHSDFYSEGWREGYLLKGGGLSN